MLSQPLAVLCWKGGGARHRKAGSGWIRASSVPGALPQARLRAASINNSGGRRRSGDGRRGPGRKMFNHSGHLRSATLGLRCNAARPRDRRQPPRLPSPPGASHTEPGQRPGHLDPRVVPGCAAPSPDAVPQPLYFQLSLFISSSACLQASPGAQHRFLQPAAVARGSRGAVLPCCYRWGPDLWPLHALGSLC